VAVHDVVRPLVDQRLFSAVLAGARTTGAAIPGLPVSDTLKRIDPRGYVAETVPRNAYVQAQTPQVFRRELLERAYQQARAQQFAATDDAGLVERLGVAVRVIPGSRHNIKITVPEDREWAEWFLRSREGW
jgi:2-C-methyl-D-erythritol 4-phosphate cytidylyltransferase